MKEADEVETRFVTDGFGGGSAHARKAPPELRAEQLVQMRLREGARMASEKGARPALQRRTGSSNCGGKLTVESISRMPRWMRWGLYAFAASVALGVAPMALAALLIWLCGVVGWWLAPALLAAAGCVLWRVMWR